MRILLISDHADPLAEVGSKEAGGQNIYVLYLAKHLCRLGISVDVYTRWDRKNKKEIVEVRKDLRVIRVKAGPKHYMSKNDFLNVVPEFAEKILDRIKKEKLRYDIIHANYWFSGLIGLKISESIKKPLVHVYHSIGKVRLNTFRGRGDLEERKDEHYMKRLAAEREIAQKSAGIISTSPVEKQIIKKIFKVGGEKIKPIPVGVDTNIFYPMKTQKARKLLRIPEEERAVLYVGRIEWRKGIGVLLYAFHKIAKLMPHAKLYIIGGAKSQAGRKLEDGEWERLRKNTEDLGLGDRIVFLGAQKQKNLRKFYSAFDVCVVPSYYEPFGIVPLEAMACGMPVVASKTGGLKYTIQAGSTGQLAEPGNHEDLAQKIYLALRDGKNFYKPNCLDRIENFFRWEKIAEDYENYFNQLLAN